MSTKVHINGTMQTPNGGKDFELVIHVNENHAFHGEFKCNYFKKILPVIGFFYTGLEEKKLVFAHSISKEFHQLSVFYSLHQVAPTHWVFSGHWGEPHGKRVFLDFHPYKFNDHIILEKLARYASQVDKTSHNLIKFRKNALADILETLTFDYA